MHLRGERIVDKMEYTREEAVTELKEICQDIGCSGMSPDICQTKPHLCDIIRKLVMSNGFDNA